MKLAHQFRFALIQLWREYKSGELTVLLLALVIAIASHTTVGHLSDRISRAVTENANKLIAGDLILTGQHAIDGAVVQLARQQDIASASTQKFRSVITANDAILLVTVKSVSEHYPLKGEIKIADELYGVNRPVRHGPLPGTAWVESRVIHALGLSLGDAIHIGDTRLTVDQILIQEPDRIGGYYDLTPRVMMNAADLTAANVIQPGSRVRYQMMFSGRTGDIERFRESIEPQLKANQTLHALGEERPGVANTLEKARQYMGLASLIALLLATVAVAGSGRYYIQRHFDTSALLRCFGAKQRDIVWIFLFQLTVIALSAGLLGNMAGALIQHGLLWTVRDLLPPDIPAARWSVVWSGLGLSLVVLIGFTAPSILRLKSVSPQRVLRQDLTPLPASARVTYGLTGMLVTGIMWFYTGNLILTLGILVGSLTVLTVTLGLVFAVLKGVEQCLPLFPRPIRSGARNFLRRKWPAGTQTTAFALTVMALLITVLIRTELIDTWKSAMPEDASNFFILNLQPDDTARYRSYLDRHQIQTDRLYPVVRGRLTHINQSPVIKHVSKEERHNESLTRELNFTWTTDIPPDNQILEGQWFDGNHTQPLVSIESELADDLDINLHDHLTFVTGSQQWDARVSSIRSVKWDNFKPNFYMIFNQTALEALPTTWINGFYIEPERKQLLVDLVQHFPAITLIELDSVLTQINLIIDQVTLVIQALLAFVLASGFAVTLSELKSSMRERINEGAILRTLGSSRQHIILNQWSEFATMGLIAGFVGVLGTEVVNFLIYDQLFEIDYQPTGWIWLIAPLLSALVVAFLGVRNSRPVLTQSPVISLRQ